jgi:hypothetical protein
MTAPIQINHRRERQQVRRVLAQLVIQGRDLTGSFFPNGFDLIDGRHRLSFNDNDKDGLAVAREAVQR